MNNKFTYLSVSLFFYCFLFFFIFLNSFFLLNNFIKKEENNKVINFKYENLDLIINKNLSVLSGSFNILNNKKISNYNSILLVELILNGKI